MRKPKYEPLKMGNKKHADNYGIKMRRYLKWQNEQELIKRKLNGETLSEQEFIQLHNFMMETDKEYSDSVDKELRKAMRKYVPKGTKIS